MEHLGIGNHQAHHYPWLITPSVPMSFPFIHSCHRNENLFNSSYWLVKDKTQPWHLVTIYLAEVEIHQSEYILHGSSSQIWPTNLVALAIKHRPQNGKLKIIQTQWNWLWNWANKTDETWTPPKTNMSPIVGRCIFYWNSPVVKGDVPTI